MDDIYRTYFIICIDFYQTCNLKQSASTKTYIKSSKKISVDNISIVNLAVFALLWFFSQ